MSYATPADYAECRRLHRAHGATYYFATSRLPRAIRPRVHALYGFVRQADEWVDNPGELSVDQRARRLADWRSEFLRGMEGVRPESGILRAFCDACLESRVPLEEPLVFLDAMEMDLKVDRYKTYEDLRGYMRGSAAAVGVMMTFLVDGPTDEATLRQAIALAEAMQLTNFLRDVGEDLERGRIYLPLEDMERFGVREEDLTAKRVSPEFIQLMRFEIARARENYALSDPGISKLPAYVRRGVRLARVLYAMILERIEANGYDVFTRRARTSGAQKLATLLKLTLS